MQNLLGGANYLAEELVRFAVTDVVLHGAARVKLQKTKEWICSPGISLSLGVCSGCNRIYRMAEDAF
jgi:hypothetical protein